MKLKILLAASIFVGASFVAESRDFRVNQIPNGGKFQSQTFLILRNMYSGAGEDVGIFFCLLCIIPNSIDSNLLYFK